MLPNATACTKGISLYIAIKLRGVYIYKSARWYSILGADLLSYGFPATNTVWLASAHARLLPYLSADRLSTPKHN